MLKKVLGFPVGGYVEGEGVSGDLWEAWLKYTSGGYTVGRDEFRSVCLMVGEFTDEQMLEIYARIHTDSNVCGSWHLEYIRGIVEELINDRGLKIPERVDVTKRKKLKFVEKEFSVVQNPQTVKQGRIVEMCGADVKHHGSRKNGSLGTQLYVMNGYNQLFGMRVKDTGMERVVTTAALSAGGCQPHARWASWVSLAKIEATPEVWEKIFSELSEKCETTRFALNPEFYKKCVENGWIS